MLRSKVIIPQMKLELAWKGEYENNGIKAAEFGVKASFYDNPRTVTLLFKEGDVSELAKSFMTAKQVVNTIEPDAVKAVNSLSNRTLNTVEYITDAIILIHAKAAVQKNPDYERIAKLECKYVDDIAKMIVNDLDHPDSDFTNRIDTPEYDDIRQLCMGVITGNVLGLSKIDIAQKSMTMWMRRTGTK